MAEKNSNLYEFTMGIIKQNPTLVTLLGMCPTLAVTTMAKNGIGMGLATTFVLVCSNFVISLLKNVIPKAVRLPCFIVIIAGFVTLIEFLMKGFIPELYSALGVCLTRGTGNCIILGRAEAFASKNKIFPSILDGLGMGLGFTIGLVCIGFIRQILGATLGITIFIMAPGAFLVLAFLVAGMNCVREAMEKKGKPLAAPSGCITGDCAGCDHLSMCTGKLPEETADTGKEEGR